MNNEPELRDIFAAAVLMGLIASKPHSLNFDPIDDADYCYRLADAMLKRRAKEAHQ